MTRTCRLAGVEWGRAAWAQALLIHDEKVRSSIRAAVTKVWRLNAQLRQRRGGAEKIFNRSITGSLSLRVESYTNCCASMLYAKQLCVVEVEFLCMNPTFRKLSCCLGTEHEQQNKVMFSRTDIKCLLKEEDSFVIIFLSIRFPLSVERDQNLFQLTSHQLIVTSYFFLNRLRKKQESFFISSLIMRTLHDTFPWAVLALFLSTGLAAPPTKPVRPCAGLPTDFTNLPFEFWIETIVLGPIPPDFDELYDPWQGNPVAFFRSITPFYPNLDLSYSTSFVPRQGSPGSFLLCAMDDLRTRPATMLKSGHTLTTIILAINSWRGMWRPIETISRWDLRPTKLVVLLMRLSCDYAQRKDPPRVDWAPRKRSKQDLLHLKPLGVSFFFRTFPFIFLV